MTDFKKTKPKLGFANARVDKDDLLTLKKYNINVSDLISAHIKKYAEKLRKND